MQQVDQYKRSFWALVLVILTGGCPLKRSEEIDPAPFAAKDAVTVDRVVDGDTIIVQLNGSRQRVRLIGVDTPETVAASRPVEFFGKEASNFTKEVLEGRQVWLVEDSQGDTVDQYGRKLAYVYRSPDGLFVNLEIIRQGYGHAFTRYPFDYMDEFRQAERDARRNGVGLLAEQD